MKLEEMELLLKPAAKKYGEGKKIAKKRLLKNYYASLDKRVAKFHDAAIVFNGKVFETSEEVKNNA